MNTTFNKAILAALGAALYSIHPANAQDTDRWGQTVPPAAEQKLAEAIKTAAENPAKAEQMIKEVLAMKPDYYRAQYNLGLINIAQNKKTEAVEEMLKAFRIQESLTRKDPSIYTDLGRAYAQAGDTKAAAGAFENGAKVIKQLDPADQERLLQHGISYFVGEQNPAAGFRLLKQVKPDLNPTLAPKVDDFLNKAVARLKANDVEEGWVRYKSDAPDSQLFTRLDGADALPEEGQKITPKEGVVYLRDRALQPENTESPLGRAVGFARVGETFTVMGKPVPVKITKRPDFSQQTQTPAQDVTAWWVKVKREKAP